MRVIGDLSSANARRYPGKCALRQGERSLSYSELDARSNQLANALIKRGVAVGDRVALLAYNCIEYAIVTQGVAKAGAILVPLNFRLAALELAHLLRDADPVLLVAEQSFDAAIQAAQQSATTSIAVWWLNDAEFAVALDSASESAPAVCVEPADPCVIVYTSGTTGRPKGVLVAHAAYFRMYAATAIDTGLRHDDVFLMAVPMFHAAGMNLMLHQALFLGATGIVHRGAFEPEVIFALMEQHQVTMTVLVPTIIGLMARHPARHAYPLRSWRCAFYGSMPMPPPILRDAMAAFPQVAFHQLYGSTESGMLAVLKWSEHRDHASSTGREALFSTLRIVDESQHDVAVGEIGEVWGERSIGMLGYWRNPAATAEAMSGDWIHTGDLARREAAGYFTVVGRIKEMINTGGENVYPTEVERVLAEHPAVREVAVFGIPDALFGEQVCAAVVVRSEMALSAESLDQWCREQLAGYKRPRRYLMLSALPRNANDKVQKAELRRMVAATAISEETP
jgi:fatty-acyl-CoA synthase